MAVITDDGDDEDNTWRHLVERGRKVNKACAWWVHSRRTALTQRWCVFSSRGDLVHANFSPFFSWVIRR